MSTVKISQLAPLYVLNANTANTIFPAVDLPSGITGKITATTLAQGLYANNVLNVGVNPITLPNVLGQFSGTSDSYTQVNLQNFSGNGSGDFVITANNGTDTTNYIDMGINGSNYSDSAFSAYRSNDGYLYVGPSTTNAGNLVIGTATSGANVVFAVGGTKSANIVSRMSTAGLSFVGNTYITFSDGTVQSTAAASNTYTVSAYATANTASGNTVALQSQMTTSNTNILSVNTFAQSAYNKANNALANTSGAVFSGDLRITGNLISNTITTSASIDTFTSNNATFTKNVIVFGNLTANTLLGNIFFSNVVTTTSQSNSIIWFAQPSIIGQQAGQLWYSSNTESLVLDTEIPGDRPSISKVLFFRCYNSTGNTIPANSVIRITGGIDKTPNISLADATSAANATVAGFVSNAIANGAYGYAYSQGIIENFNASGLGNTGDIIFLSATPGQISNVAPTGSNTVVQLGRIISNSATQGKLLFQPQLRQAYGRQNGSALYAYANNIVSSNTLYINDSTGTVNANTFIANTIVYGSATANTMVTQQTNKSTSVTANGTSGQITMNGAALAGQAYVSFTVNNSYVYHTNDIIIVNIQNSVTTPNPYMVCVGKVSVGSFQITLYNMDSGGGSSHSDAVILNWSLIRVGT
jgi:hypothetical protein